MPTTGGVDALELPAVHFFTARFRFSGNEPAG